MKKISFIILFIILSLTMSACNGKNDVINNKPITIIESHNNEYYAFNFKVLQPLANSHLKLELLLSSGEYVDDHDSYRFRLYYPAVFDHQASSDPIVFLTTGDNVKITLNISKTEDNTTLKGFKIKYFTYEDQERYYEHIKENPNALGEILNFYSEATYIFKQP